MALAEDDVARIRRSWALAAQNGELAAELFYGRLFRIAPELRGMFPPEIAGQRRKLTLTLGVIVEHLDRPETFLPAARELARRHVGYGVTAAQYAPVGEALVWALAQLLGSRFGAAEERSWRAAYVTLADVMIAEAYPTAAPAGEGARPTG